MFSPEPLNAPGRVVSDQVSASSAYPIVVDPSATIITVLCLNVDDPSSVSPLAILLQFPAASVGRTSVVQVLPSILTAPLVPPPTARNFPDCAVPAKSNSTIAPVALLTAITVIVISFAVVAPPTLVPAIVSVSSRVYPVPAALVVK